MGYVGCHLSISNGYISMAKTAGGLVQALLRSLSGIPGEANQGNHHRKNWLLLKKQLKSLPLWWFMVHTL